MSHKSGTCIILFTKNYVLNNFDLGVSKISPAPAISGIMELPSSINDYKIKSVPVAYVKNFVAYGQDADIILSTETIHILKWEKIKFINSCANLYR